MSLPLTIRAATPADVAVLVEFNAAMALETEQLRLDRPTLTAGVRRALDDPGKARYFVAEHQGRVIGQAMLTTEWSDWRNGDIWWLQSVYVDRAFRRRGAFRLLYRHIESLARREGVAALRLYMERENGVAQATYERLGMHLSQYVVMEQALERRVE